MGPRFFLDGHQDAALLSAVRSGLEAEITFAHHFSKAYVDCGTGCGSYWFVDRRTGAVVESPNEAPDGQMVWDVETRRDSDVVGVTYGARDGASDQCGNQSFRWNGQQFERITELQSVICPR